MQIPRDLYLGTKKFSPQPSSENHKEFPNIAKVDFWFVVSRPRIFQNAQKD